MTGDQTQWSDHEIDEAVQPVIPDSSIDTHLLVDEPRVVTGNTAPDTTPFIGTITSRRSLEGQINTASIPDRAVEFFERTDFDTAIILMVGHHTLDDVGLTVDRIVHQEETLYVTLSETQSPDHEYPTVDRLNFLGYFIRVPSHHFESSPSALGSLTTTAGTAVELSARNLSANDGHQG